MTQGPANPFSGPTRMLVVLVEYVDGHFASVMNDFGTRMMIDTDYMRARGMLPQPGERWFVDRTYGPYTFAMIAGPRRGPEIVDDFDCTMSFMLGL